MNSFIFFKSENWWKNLYTYLSCWESPPKCTCLDFPASLCKNALRSYYILRGVLHRAALLLTPWEAKCGAFALSQGAQKEKLVLAWVSLGGPVLAQELCVGGWGQGTGCARASSFISLGHLPCAVPGLQFSCKLHEIISMSDCVMNAGYLYSFL